MAPHVQRVLVSLCLVFVLESVPAVIALVLFLCFVGAVESNITVSPEFKSAWLGSVAYVNSSRVSNFLGFLGQQSHMKKPCDFPVPVLMRRVGSVNFLGLATFLASLGPRW